MNVLKVRGITKLSNDDLLALVSVCASLGIQPDWLVTVMSFETGGSFSPSQRNGWAAKKALRTGKPYSGAIGLIQFMPSTAKNLGTSSEALAKMTFIEQLVFVEKYFRSYKGRMKSLEDCYLAVFYPAAIGQPDSWVVATKDGSILNNKSTANVKERLRSQAIYVQNAGFGKGGKITRADICRTIRAVRDAAKGERISVLTQNSHQHIDPETPAEAPAAQHPTYLPEKIFLSATAVEAAPVSQKINFNFIKELLIKLFKIFSKK